VTLLERYRQIRARTLELCAPLTVEDQAIQPMPDASPTKWHLAHTTWFFEEFVLGQLADPSYSFLYNSYYEAVGPRVDRPRRGAVSRPGLDRVLAYRAEVDRRIETAAALDPWRLELGLHHEQQHQELILTDIKNVLGMQPLRPAYRELPRTRLAPLAQSFVAHAGGVVEIGAPADGFAYDNERPRHRVLVHPFELATRPIANAEVLAFIEAGGYREPRHWLSDGWATVMREGWTAPLYWNDGSLYELAGVRAIDPAEVACHLSYYEADAIAHWLGARLPTELEWELAAGTAIAGNFADDDRLHPGRGGSPFGDVWEWTSSAYLPYPGYRPFEGALGEYNGKFMSGQQVLRGGSCFTPRSHLRASYRNFFTPSARWQMSGARIAKN